MKIQDIQTKRTGLACPINVMNHSGHDVLTTYETGVDNSVEVATQDFADFMDRCVSEFRVKPNAWGRKHEDNAIDGMQHMLSMDEIKAPEFDLGAFAEIAIHPVPLTGG